MNATKLFQEIGFGSKQAVTRAAKRAGMDPESLSAADARELLNGWRESHRLTAQQRANVVRLLGQLPNDAKLNPPAPEKAAPLPTDAKPDGTNRNILLLIAGFTILLQAAHFAHLIQLVSPFESKPVSAILAWGIGLTVESTALFLTVNAKRGTMVYLWVFCILSVLIDLLCYDLGTGPLRENLAKAIISVTLPVSILSFSHLYVRK